MVVKVLKNIENIIVKQISIINNKDMSKATNIDLKTDKDYIPDGVQIIIMALLE